ncbi:MAG: four helix bundle protein [Pseudomonadota bacterium]
MTGPKMGVVEEEADESLYWMELLIEASIMELQKVYPLMQEAGEILAMTVASINTAKRNFGIRNQYDSRRNKE